MSRERKTLTATCVTLGIPGRVMAVASNRVMVIDSTSGRSNMEPEAMTAGDAFLSSLIGCAGIIVDAVARSMNIPMQKASFACTASRYSDDPSNFTDMTIDVEISGVTQSQAEELVGAYQAQCPIYRLAEKGSSMVVTVKAV
jgi:uncharacterized OsmC-like protein